ncbi:glycosyltransferase [Hymenobacter sp. BT175]|uniref:glycosyltransferase n=1 Tax=Hymenobacter translucens TaxID=2886507 RepID=UPI001D0DF67D|nr:glycosyltransferase [Hymenobacter translucens]MCC2545248.1 glycosyltransferase [Hymenobacter translucens]
MVALGLSVLIPVYNRDVSALVQDLLSQAPSWPGPVEVLLFDDKSEEGFQALNRPLAALPGVRYKEMPANQGRAAIRNHLAAAAGYPWLLLLDNDSQLPDAQFLSRYAAVLGRTPAAVGGTCYEAQPPADPALHLRWLYGREREARPAAVRNQDPHAQLTLNNLLIDAALFRQFGLDESLTRYGHEDTKFGWRLRQAAVPVLHLDNPVLHDGLEPAGVFLAKTHDAVRNLARLYQTEGLGGETRLVQTARRLQKLRLAAAARYALSQAEARLRRNLLSRSPSLRQLDLLKLLWFLQELRIMAPITPGIEDENNVLILSLGQVYDIDKLSEVVALLNSETIKRVAHVLIDAHELTSINVMGLELLELKNKMTKLGRYSLIFCGLKPETKFVLELLDSEKEFGELINFNSVEDAKEFLSKLPKES